MAVFYVSHSFGGKPANLERAKQITHDLQVNDPENCYICPLIAFSYLGYNEIGYDEEMELCIDLLSRSEEHTSELQSTTGAGSRMPSSA